VLFNKTMVELTRLVANEVARAYDFTVARTVVDVGGGYGELIIAVLRQAPHLSGTLFDLPHAIDDARRSITEKDLSARCTCVAGNFFDSVPPEADLYILKSIIHDWPDDRARTILENCRRAMPSDGRLLIVERVRPDRAHSCETHLHTLSLARPRPHPVWSDRVKLVHSSSREEELMDYPARDVAYCPSEAATTRADEAERRAVQGGHGGTHDQSPRWHSIIAGIPPLNSRSRHSGRPFEWPHDPNKRQTLQISARHPQRNPAGRRACLPARISMGTSMSRPELRADADFFAP
jgi:hypothetical protein